MQLIDGKKLAAEIRSNPKNQISNLGFTPGLGVILVGNDSASHLYIKLKEQACEEVGIKFEKIVFSETALQKDIIAAIQKFNKKNNIHGILVQLPLPAAFDTDSIIAKIDPKKDVDGFHPKNLQLLKAGQPRVLPPTPAGIIKLIKSTGVDLKKGKAVLLVNSEIFTLPIKYLLEKSGVLVDVKINPEPSTLNSQLLTFDIIIIALGQPKFLNSKMVKDGAIVIDVGTTKIGEKIIGDADFDSFQNKKGWITPVPNGVGPMTVAMLLNNVLELTLKK